MEQNIDRIAVIELRGAMAHFRQFYTNSSSLTYSFLTLPRQHSHKT